MANTEQEQAFNAWLKGRPDVIVDMAEKLKPWLRYRVKTTGQHCSLYSYSEDGTVTVVVYGHDNPVLDKVNEMTPISVFSMSPDDLEELDPLTTCQN